MRYGTQSIKSSHPIKIGTDVAVLIIADDGESTKTPLKHMTEPTGFSSGTPGP
jgi:hypothetical protein